MTSNSSTIAPAEDGNTKSSSASNKSKQQAERKHWILTVAWPDETQSPKGLELWLRNYCTRYAMQIERGEETGYSHLQLAMSLKTKERLTWLKTHFRRDAHCEIIRNQERAFDYCMKEDTRVAGPWIWPEPPPTLKDPMRGLERKPWQLDIIKIIETEADARTIHWYWDSVGNTGKTTFTKHLWINYKVCFVQNGKKADIAYAYNNEPIVIFNLPRTCENFVSYDAIESLKDGMIFSGKYESGAKVFNNPHVIIFANFEPDQSCLSQDRWHIVEID